jgi:hypothetical protein
MSRGYFDSLGDEVPSYLVAAMNEALTDATHHGKGVEGEPVFLAGVRALWARAVSRDELGEANERCAQRQRAEFERHQEELQEVTRRAREQVAAELVALARARSLLDVRRKTVPMADLRQALDPQG